MVKKEIKSEPCATKMKKRVALQVVAKVKATKIKATTAKAKEAKIYQHLQASDNDEALASQVALQTIVMSKEDALT
jgi:hypothetical protein